MAHHHLEPLRPFLHGYFSRDLAPVITIASGDTVTFRTLDSGWGQIDQKNPFEKPVKFEPRNREEDPDHALVGPIAVRGARPGTVSYTHLTLPTN